MNTSRPPFLMKITSAFVSVAAQCCCFHSATLAQAVLPLINYQGRPTDACGMPLPDGAYRIAFKLWNDPTASSTNAPTHLTISSDDDSTTADMRNVRLVALEL